MQSDLMNNLVQNSDIETGPAATVNFRDIYQFIDVTPELKIHGQNFHALIQSMEAPIQALVNHEIIATETLPEISARLLALLEFIKSHIAEYTGAGIPRAVFDREASDFLQHISRSEYQNENEGSISMGVLFSFAATIPFTSYGAFDVATAQRGYDDDNSAKYDDMQQHHVYSDARTTRLRNTGIGLLSAGFMCLLFTIYLGRKAYLKFLRETHLNNVHQHLTECHQQVVDAVARLHSTYCEPRITVEDFQRSAQLQPRYFYELAAKSCAVLCAIDPVHGHNKDEENIISVLNEFSAQKTPEGEKFNRLLHESSSANMNECIDHLLNIPVIQNEGVAITLRANHILGNTAKEFIWDCITDLRAEMSLKAWPPAIANDIDTAVDEAIARTSAEQVDKTLTATSSSHYYYATRDTSSSSSQSNTYVAVAEEVKENEVFNPIAFGNKK